MLRGRSNKGLHLTWRLVGIVFSVQFFSSDAMWLVLLWLSEPTSNSSAQLQGVEKQDKFAPRKSFGLWAARCVAGKSLLCFEKTLEFSETFFCFFLSLIRLLNQVTALEFGDLLMIFSLSSSSPPALDSCAKKEKRKGEKSAHLCRVNATVPIILIICISYRLTNKAVSW